MTKAELVATVALRVHLTKKTTEEVLDALFDELGAAAARERISLPGFGVFRPGARKARAVTNPRTKERMRLPKSYGVKFSPAKELKAKARAAAEAGASARSRRGRRALRAAGVEL